MIAGTFIHLYNFYVKIPDLLYPTYNSQNSHTTNHFTKGSISTTKVVRKVASHNMECGQESDVYRRLVPLPEK